MTGCPPEIATKRDYELFLRRGGFSRSAAKRLARAWDDTELQTEKVLRLTEKLEELLTNNSQPVL